MSDKKYFTVEEANLLIPDISDILKELVDLKKKIELKIPEIKPVLSKSSSNGGGDKSLSKHLVSIKKMEELTGFLNKTGCILKDINMGLIDFPHMKDGREVYLCWKLGEKKISFWHEIEAGYAGRKPVDSNNNLVD